MCMPFQAAGRALLNGVATGADGTSVFTAGSDAVTSQFSLLQVCALILIGSLWVYVYVSCLCGSLTLTKLEW